MADIRPFRGVHYNQSLVKDLAGVICPPYDIITPRMRQELYQRSQHNFVRLEFAEELPGDTPAGNRYTHSATALEEWLNEGILKIDERPAIYLYDQSFTYQGREYKRRGMTVIVKLEEWSKMVVRPHEDTLSAPKRDRLNLMWALQADASPVFGLFEDRRQKVASLLVSQAGRKPMFDIKANGEGHRLWPVSNSRVVRQICSSLASEPLYVADGHHRYESALNYRNERRACSSPGPAEQPFDFVMMTLVDFSDPGLVILPTHRLMRGMPEATISGLTARLKEYFEIIELPLNVSDVGKQLDDIWGGEQAERPQLAVFGLAGERLAVLKLRDPAAASQLMEQSHSNLYKKLNVSVTDHVILEKLLGLTREKEAESLDYTHDRQDAVDRVTRQEYQLAFLLSPIKASVIKAIADARDRMPRKSTYFYPKLPSGLVFYRMA